MGDPRKQRSKFSGPSHPWQRTRIEEEKEVTKEYGFRSKKEIWKMKSILRNFQTQAKKVIATKTEQGEKEKIQLLKKLNRLGLINEYSSVESILGLTLKDLLERRLQSIVFRKGFAKSMLQARQFIVHEHISIGNKKITMPNYLVDKAEEDLMGFSEISPFLDEMHPERIKQEKLPKKQEKEKKRGDKKKVEKQQEEKSTKIEKKGGE